MESANLYCAYSENGFILKGKNGFELWIIHKLEQKREQSMCHNIFCQAFLKKVDYYQISLTNNKLLSLHFAWMKLNKSVYGQRCSWCKVHCAWHNSASKKLAFQPQLLLRKTSCLLYLDYIFCVVYRSTGVSWSKWSNAVLWLRKRSRVSLNSFGRLWILFSLSVFCFALHITSVDKFVIEN